MSEGCREIVLVCSLVRVLLSPETDSSAEVDLDFLHISRLLVFLRALRRLRAKVLALGISRTQRDEMSLLPSLSHMAEILYSPSLPKTSQALVLSPEKSYLYYINQGKVKQYHYFQEIKLPLIESDSNYLKGVREQWYQNFILQRHAMACLYSIKGI